MAIDIIPVATEITRLESCRDDALTNGMTDEYLKFRARAADMQVIYDALVTIKDEIESLHP